MKKVFAILGRTAVIILWSGVVCLGLFFWYGIYLAVSDYRKAPVTKEVNVTNLTYFTGRILPIDQIKPGTFTVIKPFKDINGPDTILAFGARTNGAHQDLVMRVWKPDPQTAGVFQYGERSIQIETLIEWTHYNLKEITLDQGKQFRGTLEKSLGAMIFGAIVFAVIGAILIILGMSRIPAIRHFVT